MKIMVKHIVMCLLVTVIYSYNNVVIYDELMEKTGEFHFIFKIVGISEECDFKLYLSRKIWMIEMISFGAKIRLIIYNSI